MPSCALPACKGSFENGKKLIRITRKEDLRVQWLEFLKLNGVNSINENTRICENHFEWHEICGSFVRAEIPTINNCLRRKVRYIAFTSCFDLKIIKLHFKEPSIMSVAAKRKSNELDEPQVTIKSVILVK